MKTNKPIKGWVEDIPEEDDEISIDLPQIPQLRQAKFKKRMKKFRMDSQAIADKPRKKNNEFR